jgi:hypothetical protein
MIEPRSRPRRIKLRRGGVRLQAMAIETEERRLDLTREGAPYPPIQSADDSFEAIAQCAEKIEA